MNRREFLQRSAAVAGAGLVLPLAPNAWAAVGAEPDRRLIVIFLRGAVDGLSVVVPHGDPRYYEMRSSIAIPKANGAIDLDGYFGLHPALAPVLPLWQDKTLAFVHASGSPDPSRSHFDAQAMMEAGTPGNPATRTGWLNRLLSVIPGPHAPTQAVSVGPTLPRILQGPIAVANVEAGKNAGRPIALDRPAVNKAFARLYDGQDALSAAYREGQTSRKKLLSDMDEEMRQADNGAPSATGFPAQAPRLARMMRRDRSIQIAFVALGGWDTHVRQGSSTGQLANHLGPLAEGLAALAQGLGDDYRETVVLVISEFGRTARENGNGGTDHGHGNVMWVMGGPIGGGKVYGAWPGLANDQLYQNRDLAVTTDFRVVASTVIERHMRLPDRDLATVFPGMPATKADLTTLVKA